MPIQHVAKKRGKVKRKREIVTRIGAERVYMICRRSVVIVKSWEIEGDEGAAWVQKS